MVHTYGERFGALGGIYSPAMIPLLNKPVAQQQLEQGYNSGVRDMVLVVNEGMNYAKRLLGDGTRYGVRLQILQGEQDGNECDSLLKHRFLFKERFVLTAGFVVGDIKLRRCLTRHKKSGNAISLIVQQQTGVVLAAICEPGSQSLFLGCGPALLESLKEKQVKGNSKIDLLHVKSPIVYATDLKGVLAANRQCLRDGSALAHNPYSEKEPGLFVGRGTTIHPSVKINKPVMIGNFNQIMANAEIGPDVVLGDNTIIAQKAHVQSSLVFPNSYVGAMTNIDGNVVLENTLFGIDNDSRVYILDSFLIGKVGKDIFSDFADQLINRGLALGALMALAPLAISAGVISKARNGEVLSSREVVGSGKIKKVEDLVYLPRFNLLYFPGQHKLSLWPRLISVAKGDMRLVGPEPLSPEDSEAIAEDWMTGRFRCPPGAFAVSELAEDEMEKRITENLYAKKRGFKQDVRAILAIVAKPIVGKSLARKILGL